ncbi:CotH kinase family protein [Lactobacillus amylovorus]|uniref:CotH kinase family protein n=1 Tax=Lactobacillus amylovorus TaxID=1604 RepID=UPI00201D93AC|nr:CotH kinase family protein [Lactobacillus amylovorus]
MVDNLIKVTHDNNGHFYRIKMDIAKEGSSLWDLTPYFKGRVGDNRFGLQVTWTYQGRLLDVTGMKPYISGNVGNYSFDDKKELQLADDAAAVHYTGSPDDCQSGGRAVYYFPEQMFPREGIFKGYVGLLDDRDSSSQPHISGVTVWFKVLPGIAQMGHACDVYISDLDEALSNFKETLRQHNIDYENQLSNNNTQFQQQLQQIITDARNAYNSQVANSRDAMNALDAEVKANRAELTNINDHLSGVEQQIAIHDIVTIPQHQEDLKNISNAIDERLANVKTAPVAVENSTALQQQYPNGADGIFITADTGHKWLWLSGQWTDCGEYQAVGIENELIDPIKQQQKVNEENIATNYSLINQNTAKMKENATDIQSVEGAGALTYVHITDQNGNRITDQNGMDLIGRKWLIVTDKTLTQSDLPADAKSVSSAIKDAVEFKPEKYGIPVLYLYGDKISSLKDKKDSLKNEVKYKFPKYHVQGICTNFKVQGASSAGLPKKNYTLNLDQDFEAFSGFGKQHKYVIKANYLDASQSLNVVNAKLWGKVRATHYQVSDALQDNAGNYLTDNNGNHIIAETDPQLSIGGNYGAVDGFPIALYINDQYWGLYSFNIPKDDWMAKMPSEAGYAIVDTVWVPQGALQQETNFKDQMELQFCGTKDTKWAQDSINKLIDAVIAHYDKADDFDNAVSELIDLDSAYDYYIYSVLVNNDDGLFRNYLLQTFDGKKWYFAAYDLDETFGRTPDFFDHTLANSDTDDFRDHGVTFENAVGSNRLMYQLWKFHKDEILKRAKSLINGPMSVSTVDTAFVDYVRNIPQIAFNEEIKAWPETPNTSVDNVNRIGRWYMQRLSWFKNRYLNTQQNELEQLNTRIENLENKTVTGK